jgi:transketolase N-terminal domain/subunit
MNSFEFETRNDISSVFYISKNMSQFKKVLIGDLGAIALEIRREIVTMVNRANSGHVGGSLSAVEILVALYHNLMKHDPSNPKWVERDRFIMGKGHATPVYYAVLASCGYISQEDLLGFRRPGSYLQGHPKQKTEKGIEVSTGTLGLGLSTACGWLWLVKLEMKVKSIIAFVAMAKFKKDRFGKLPCLPINTN